MNKAQKAITKAQLKEEERALKELKKTYEEAKRDCELKISALNARKDMQNLQSIIYQKKYQNAILKQIQGILNDLNKGQYQTMQDFFDESYKNGYIGTMYDFHNQDVPVLVPVDPKKVERAIKTDSKVSKGYYQDRDLPENLGKLKRNIRQEITRGIANGSSWVEVAYQIASGMNSPFDRAMRDAMRIVRTEGNRINQQGHLDACHEAQDAGADIVKQWDSTLDGNTRPAHRIADGQIRELDEPFIVDGEKLDAPCIGGSAKNVVNCRCQLLQRAKWALDEDELKELEHKAMYYQLWQGDKPKDFTEFKEKYLQLPDKVDTMKITTIDRPVDTDDPIFKQLFNIANMNNVKYNPVVNHRTQLSPEEIIKALAGGDRTQGSCASVALAYIGQKLGWNVLDFRDGESRKMFSNGKNLFDLASVKGMKIFQAKGKCSLTVGNRLLKNVEEGKEYYLCVGRHASIVRKKDGVLQYLELQSATNSGWNDFDGNPKYTLSWRFGCSNTSNYWAEKIDFLLDIEESDFDTDEFKSLLGFINTNESEQRKGDHGTIK